MKSGVHQCIAPVKFSDAQGVKFFVGAYVIRDEKTLRYKLHEVLTISEEGSALFKTESPEMEDLRSAKPSNEIIPQDGEEVKNFSLRDTEAVRRQQAKDRTRLDALSDANTIRAEERLMRESLNKWKRMPKRTEGKTVSNSDMDSAANSLTNEFNSTVSKEAVRGQLTVKGSPLHRGLF